MVISDFKTSANESARRMMVKALRADLENKAEQAINRLYDKIKNNLPKIEVIEIEELEIKTLPFDQDNKKI